jgi:D-arabinose 1-dehydrogenase-like Zn-dependent alcohol dehydrogenase
MGATYRAIEITKPGTFRLVERSVVVPGEGQVSIRVEACGVCHSDAGTVEGQLPGVVYPRVPGHEAIGRIEEVGQGVTTWQVGQRVGVGFFGGEDGTCETCRRGDTAYCQNPIITGVTSDGGYAEMMIAEARALALIPDELKSVDAAPLVCAGITTFNALRNAGRAGDTVAIQGIGGLGHLGVQYAKKMGWSRNILVHQISSRLHEREGKALTNFQRALPPPDSDLAEQILKDPYNFDFLTVATAAREREIEHGLLMHLRDLLLELGRGFSFVGSQVLLEVGDQPFYLDLLFYHVRLHCYFVIELKTGPFKPEWAGKLNFYLSAVDDLLRTGPDGPTIGLLLCESHNAPIAEYALRDIAKPIGISTYRVTRELPAPIQGEVPSIEDLQEVVEKLRADLGSKPDGDGEETYETEKPADSV